MDGKIIINELEPMSSRSREAYNSLRTNLQFCGADLKTILFTSCTPNEGKSTVTFDLARSMAESGKRVVLVDADLRKSVMVSRYKLSTTKQRLKGMAHFLSKQADAKEIVNGTNIPNLYIVLTGPLTPNPTELLNGTAFKELLVYLKANFDAVIIDSPPLGNVIDAAVMAPLCDGVVLVISCDNISYRLAADVKKQLEMAECRILGTVLNKVDASKGKYYYKYYGDYYGTYGEEK